MVQLFNKSSNGRYKAIHIACLLLITIATPFVAILFSSTVLAVHALVVLALLIHYRWFYKQK